MVKGRVVSWHAPVSRRGIVEWLLLAMVVVGLMWSFNRETRLVRGQAERAAVKATLGALRTALVLHHLQSSVTSDKSSVVMAQHNPFELLQRHPLNYVGMMDAVQALAAPAGSWLFDPQCECVGYMPLNADWFESFSGSAMAWYIVRGAPGGPLQLVPKESYWWLGERFD